MFFLVFLYACLRPFDSLYSRLFFICGSVFGFISMLDQQVSSFVALYFGIDRVADLYLYSGLLTSFFFIGLSIDRFRRNEIKINTLARKVAILEAEKKS